jgi:hypothetical protein
VSTVSAGIYKHASPLYSGIISLVPSTEQVTQSCNNSCLYSGGNPFGISDGAPNVVMEFSRYSTYQAINGIVHVSFNGIVHVSFKPQLRLSKSLEVH